MQQSFPSQRHETAGFRGENVLVLCWVQGATHRGEFQRTVPVAGVLLLTTFPDGWMQHQDTENAWAM